MIKDLHEITIAFAGVIFLRASLFAGDFPGRECLMKWYMPDGSQIS
jgi:hypothetical protein